MPRGVEHRTVSPIIETFRAVLRGRNHKNALRYSDLVSRRVQPPPDVPGGPYHRTTKIYYCTRDARREVQPPLVIASASTKQIATGKEKTVKAKALTPGKPHRWD
ncbi:NADH dehydrogenase [ubiquinone] 1 alpha subcomplex subunit 7-like [Belonocnema kinseyi]|uniref:NADH dehydrogenase [ubiquinone] 1 alpha subcomplex subunit 7-like n=1 Tax=Belonocnema kinseyi TaxID=2817044 RepID=UPI00143E086E|nr:NADH dehydrogenase [ubiquinone] 1 alpha subcomplex subunit 7-like [Belonocnema kinseyi]